MAAAEICMLSYDENFHLYDWVWMGRAVGFDLMYNPFFMNGYHLNRMTSIWIFAIAGLVYAIVEYKIWRRGQTQNEQKAT